MKLGILHPSFAGSGGAEVLAAAQAGYLVARGHEVCLATMAWNEARWAGPLSGVELRLVPKRSLGDVFSLGKIGKIRSRAKRLMDRLKDREVILAHTFPAEIMAGEWAGAARKVWYCHEPPRGLHAAAANPALAARIAHGLAGDATDGERWFHGRMQGKVSGARLVEAEVAAVRAFDLVLANSAFTRDNARRIYGADVAMEVLHPMLKLPEPRPRPSGLDRASPGILVHSRLDALKNIDTMIRAFARFHGAHPGAKLHIVGEGPNRPALESLARELVPGGAVLFHGYLPQADLDEVYRACGIFALLPFDEPFGMVFPEAAARGLLLVGPDHGGPLEILEGGELGQVCDAFDPGPAAEALERILAMDDAAVDALRAAAETRCRERYSADALGPRLERALRGGL